MSSRQKSSGVSFSNGIGSSSLLVTFIILCLVSFATLSIVSANADYKLSGKVLERTTAYYEASNQAETQLSQLHGELAAAYASCEDEAAYFARTGHEVSYRFPISDLQSLDVKAEILYPSDEKDAYYRILSWQVVLTGDLEYEGTIQFLEP